MESASGSTPYGVDVSALTSTSAWSCMVGNGISFAVVRGYRSSGSIDSNVCSNLKNAQSGGVTHRDTYLFPCPKCGTSGGSQIKTMVDYVNTNCKSAWSGRVWLDIEGTDYWVSHRLVLVTPLHKTPHFIFFVYRALPTAQTNPFISSSLTTVAPLD